MELKEIVHPFVLLLFLSFFHCCSDAGSLAKSQRTVNKPVSVRRRLGQNVTLSCHLPHTVVEWRFKRRKIYSPKSLLDARYSIYIKQEQNALFFENASFSDSGVYECFDDSGGLPKETYNLTVDDGPQPETVEPDTTTPAGNDFNILTTDSSVFDEKEHEVSSIWHILGFTFVGGLCLGVIIGVAVKPMYLCMNKKLCQGQTPNGYKFCPSNEERKNCEMDDMSEPAAPDNEDQCDSTRTAGVVQEQGPRLYEGGDHVGDMNIVMPKHEQYLEVAEVHISTDGSHGRVAETVHQHHVPTEQDHLCDLKEENGEQPVGRHGSENTELLKLVTKLKADTEAMRRQMNEMTKLLTYDREKNPEHSGTTLDAGGESFSIDVTDKD